MIGQTSLCSVSRFLSLDKWCFHFDRLSEFFDKPQYAKEARLLDCKTLVLYTRDCPVLTIGNQLSHTWYATLTRFIHLHSCAQIITWMFNVSLPTILSWIPTELVCSLCYPIIQVIPRRYWWQTDFIWLFAEELLTSSRKLIHFYLSSMPLSNGPSLHFMWPYYSDMLTIHRRSTKIIEKALISINLPLQPVGKLLLYNFQDFFF